MTVNHFFQSGIPESFTANQQLIERLIIQSLKITGMEMYYIPRTLIKVDTVLSEATVSEFKDAFNIEMYLENVQGFEGDGSFMSKFGIQINDSCTLVVARRRWEEEVGRTGKSTLNRPCEGDIIFMPLTKSFFEIKKVVADNPFYQLGKLFIYKLECDLFRYSSEEFSTGNDDIDNLINPKTLFENDFTIVDENGGDVLDEGGMPVAQDESLADRMPGVQNDVFDSEAPDTLDFSESNPFGDVR